MGSEMCIRDSSKSISCRFHVIEGHNHEIVWDVHRRRLWGKCKHTSVVTVFESKNAFSSGVVLSKCEGHEVGLGAGVRKPNLFKRWKPFGQQSRCFYFDGVGGTKGKAGFESRANSLTNGCWAMA